MEVFMRYCPLQHRRPALIYLVLLFVMFASSPPTITDAAFTTNITPDSTMGTTKSQTPGSNVYNINSGTIKSTNLFHSFAQFSVGTCDIASFTVPSGILYI